MNIIVTLPVKNEAWILRSSLKNFSDFADHIIVADQGSTDGSLDIYAEFSKVRVIRNDAVGHSNAVRWKLLDEARTIPGDNLILCIDADEMISPDAVALMKEKALAFLSQNPGKTIGFSLPWIQLWKSTTRHRTDGVWNSNQKTIAFTDDRKIDYLRQVKINDHTARIPETSKTMFLADYPLLHFQHAAWKQAQLKQAWYRCSELIAGKRSAKAINHAYSVSMDGASVRTENVLARWLRGIPTAFDEKPVKGDWRYAEILSWFDQHGISFFEPLQIWDLEELRTEFVSKKQRNPHPKTYSAILLAAGKIRRAVRTFLSPSAFSSQETVTDTITIITRSSDVFTKERIKYELAVIASRIKGRNRGPLGVLESLMKGLESEGIPYLLNPSPKNITGTVHVLSGSRALAEMIRLKDEGRLQTLIAGPNITVLPTDFGGIITSKQIDCVLQPSAWTADVYGRVSPEMAGKIRVWAAGVEIPDITSIKPAGSRSGIIVFRKSVPDEIYSEVIAELEKRKIEYSVFSYGSFSKESYLAAAGNARGMIYLQEVESQGLALQEAWARDVPTLAWNKGSFTYPGTDITAEGAISAPYLTEAAGMTFSGSADFSDSLSAFLEKMDSGSFAPREYCAENLSNEASARNYWAIVTSLKS